MQDLVLLDCSKYLCLVTKSPFVPLMQNLSKIKFLNDNKMVLMPPTLCIVGPAANACNLLGTVRLLFTILLANLLPRRIVLSWFSVILIKLFDRKAFHLFQIFQREFIQSFL